MQSKKRSARMRTAAYKVDVASDRRRRENVPRHILYSFTENCFPANYGMPGRLCSKEDIFMKLLYAEDEESMAEAVTDILVFHKYQVDTVYDGEEALEYARNEQYDGIILDIMMPKRSGLEVLEAIRKDGCRTPVLLLTAKAEVEDRIKGLDMGADDYLPKPFVMGELLARVRAMLRRREEFTPDILTCGNLSLSM